MKNDHLWSFFNIIYTFLGSIFEPCYIQNRVITNRVIKRLKCIMEIEMEISRKTTTTEHSLKVTEQQGKERRRRFRDIKSNYKTSSPKRQQSLTWGTVSLRYKLIRNSKRPSQMFLPHVSSYAYIVNINTSYVSSFFQMFLIHYENTPIQIYFEFYHLKNENFRIKILIFFIYLLKTKIAGTR